MPFLRLYSLDRIPKLPKIAGLLGEISYLTYLLHFPIQSSFVIVGIVVLPIDYPSTSVLILYVSLVLFLSILSFSLYEKPKKILLRGRVFIWIFHTLIVSWLLWINSFPLWRNKKCFYYRLFYLKGFFSDPSK